MMRKFLGLSLAASLSLIALPTDVFAGRGGGRGGGMPRGGGGYNGGGMQRGGFNGGGYNGGGMQRGGGHNGGMQRGGGYNGGGGMSHSPAMSQPHYPGNESSAGGRSNPYANSGGANGRSSAGNNPYAAGSGYANRNSSTLPNNGAAAVGAGYANRNSSTLPNNGAGAVGAAAGAGYANRNSSTFPNNGAGAVGAAAGAGYANRNNAYNGLGANAWGAGYWNGNNTGAWGMAAYGNGYGGVGAWSTGSPMYGWGYSGYSNPYYGGYSGDGAAQSNNAGAPGQAGSNAPATDYSQPISTTSPAPEQAAADLAASAFAQARSAFKSGDYPGAAQACQQGLTQSPNDATLHEFVALIAFAQGQYDSAAAPLYAALSTGPGWDWTTLSGFYPDVETYTAQLRNLETFTRANPNSAQARFVLGYQYQCQGHDDAAAAQFKQAARLQPGDTLSAQLAAQYQPAGAAPPVAPPSSATGVAGNLTGSWTAARANVAQVSLTIRDDGGFTWTAAGQGKPAATITGSSSLSDGVLTLTSQDPKDGGLAGGLSWSDPNHFTFRLVGAPATDKGLDFAR